MTTLGVVFTALGFAALAVLVFLMIASWRSPIVHRRSRPDPFADQSNPALWGALYGAGGTQGHPHHGHINHGGSHAHGDAGGNFGGQSGAHSGGHGGGFDGGGGGHGGGGHG